ncbi:hypothetical protein ACJJTC_012476 [Scirpophaga incertulas]
MSGREINLLDGHFARGDVSCRMSQTLPPKGNTTFTVVYLGRHEGPVSASLYIHTSIGVFKYQVSAEGVASEWDVWPLLGLRVPLNATYEPLLTLYNPTARTVQMVFGINKNYCSDLRLNHSQKGKKAP